MILEQLKSIKQLSSEKSADKDLLVIGNGPSTNYLDVNKVTQLVESRQLDLIVVNSFFSQTKLEFPDLNGIKFFYLDTQLIPLFNLSREEMTEYLSTQAMNSKDVSHSQTLLTYVMDTASSDINSIRCALERKYTKVYMHPKFREVICGRFTPLNILRYQKTFTVLAPFFANVLGYYGFSNYFGRNVINSAIMYGVLSNYRNVFVIGHGGRFEYKVGASEQNWLINYPYFYGSTNNWYSRVDSLPTFGKAYLEHRLQQFNFPKNIANKVKFLGEDHDNYALMATRLENDVFLNV